MATQWGIVGCGKISHDFVTALNCLEPGSHKVVGVAARDESKANEFAKLHKVDRVYSSYMKLAEDTEVEIAYIGVISPAHKDLVILMLEAGKAVLCEKPLGLNLEDVQEMVDKAREKGVFFMEAVWSRTFPVYKEITTRLENLGNPVNVVMTFGQKDNHLNGTRLATKANGGGTLLDWGVYCIQFAMHVYGEEEPLRVVASSLGLTHDGVDLGLSVALHFSDNRMATFVTDLRVDLPCEADIGCEGGGQIRVLSPFWCPPGIEVNGKKESWGLPTGAAHPFFFTNSQGLAFEADEVRSCLKEGLLESPKMPLTTTLAIAKVQKEIMKQIGVSYDL